MLTIEPAPVLRFIKGSPMNDPTFINFYNTKMQEYYNAYTGTPGTPGTSASPGAQAPSSSPVAPTFENIYLYLSFYNLAPESFSAILDALDTAGYKCCFFASADEIAQNADLLRRAAGTGHSIGIWLEKGTFDEYQAASALLFEATKIRVVLISAGGDAAEAAKATADSKGLVFWTVTKMYDASSKLTLGSVTGSLSALGVSRAGLNFACTDKAAAVAGPLFTYLAEKKYSVRRITERTAPTYSIT